MSDNIILIYPGTQLLLSSGLTTSSGDEILTFPFDPKARAVHASALNELYISMYI